MNKILCIPQVSSQLYSVLKQDKLSYCEKFDVNETSSYYSDKYMKYQIIDKNGMKPVEPGTIGFLAIYDLANFWSCPFVLTDIRGKIGNNGDFILANKENDD
jgi:hypothetical protein